MTEFKPPSEVLKNKLIVMTGVSGSGKSTLILEILYKALAKHFYRSTNRPGSFDKINGNHYLDKVIDIDHSH